MTGISNDFSVVRMYTFVSYLILVGTKKTSGNALVLNSIELRRLSLGETALFSSASQRSVGDNAALSREQEPAQEREQGR